MIFTRKKENIFLGIIILLVSIFPVFNYILNGFLYINAKSLIPFIILVLINTADFFTIIFQKIKPITKYLLTFYIIASSFVVCITCNLQDSLISKDKINYDFYQNYENYVNKIAYDNLYRTNTSFLDKIYINKVGNTKEYKTTIYSSTYNKEYQDSYKNIFHNPLPYRNKFMISSSNNLLFQIYMGEKYIYTKENYDNIYEKIYGSKDINIYKNNYVLPIGYSTAKVINEKDYENLSYPDSVINILGKVVNKEKTNTEIINTSKINLDYKIEDIKNMSYKETEYGYYVDVSKNAKLTLKLNNDLKDKILFISFDILENVSCKNNNDLAIKINDVKNKLTCMEWKYNNQNTNFNYTLFDFKDNTLNITLEKGIYKIGNIKISTLDFNYLKNLNDNIDPFIIDKDKTIGDKIVGSISVTEDAYFNLSIPYDKGFTILVDKEEVDYYKINNSFIGFDISKGNHEIEIIYHAPYKDISKIFSLSGVVLYVIALFIEKKLEIDSSNLL